MKKFTMTLVLLFVLSFSVSAEEGQIPASGKSCPQGQTCLTDGEIPASGKSDNSIINTVFDYLKSIFG